MSPAALLGWAAFVVAQPATTPSTPAPDANDPAVALAVGQEAFLMARCDRAAVEAAQKHLQRAKTSSDPAVRERAEFLLKMARNTLRSIRQGGCTVLR